MRTAAEDAPADLVRAAAASAPDLVQLAVAASGCTACPELVASRSTVVVGSAPAGARLLLVGEAPGAAEDESGLPFVGKSGQLLDQLLIEAGLERPGVAVANVLKCRPPRNRPPARREVGRCRGWLERQIELVDPAVTVSLGGTATAWFLGAGQRLASVRGRVHDVGGRAIVPTYHPSAAIRFGPAGAPLAALRADLAVAAALLQ